tara:strand:- start:13 stop:180 length:168 start_codon:yes stop_codon:yes gene_type:complete
MTYCTIIHTWESRENKEALKKEGFNTIGGGVKLYYNEHLPALAHKISDIVVFKLK